jgi:Acyl-CoA dehydrogenase, N-terminal domain
MSRSNHDDGSQVESDSYGSTSPFADPPWYNALSSPYYTVSHRHLRDFTRRYIDEYISPYCEEWEAQGFIPAEATQRHAELGFVAAGIFPLPVEYMSNIALPANIPPTGTLHVCRI